MFRRVARPLSRLVNLQPRWGSPNQGPLVVRSFCAGLRRSDVTVGSRSHGGKGGFDLIFLGTRSQAGAGRFPSSLALQLRAPSRPEVWIFDAGEGCISQLQRSYVRVDAVQNIFITHVHGDHIYGLPGLVLSILSRRLSDHAEDGCIGCIGSSGSSGDSGDSGSGGSDALPPLRVYGPRGIRNFLRMALGVSSSSLALKSALQINELVFPVDFMPRFRTRRSRPYWRPSVSALPFELPGRDIHPHKDPLHPGQYTYTVLGKGDDAGIGRRAPGSLKAIDQVAVGEASATVVAAPVRHTVPCLAYTVRESATPRRFDKAKLALLRMQNDVFGKKEIFQTWLRGEAVPWRGGLLRPVDVMTDGHRGRSLCVVGDTHDASGAAHIAKGVDVLVHEATNLAAQTCTARKRGHSSTRGATAFARRVQAKRLILNHISVSYGNHKLHALEAEARAFLGVDRVYVARDLSVFNIPTEEEDNEDFVFRRFMGVKNTGNGAHQRGLVMNGDGEPIEKRGCPTLASDPYLGTFVQQMDNQLDGLLRGGTEPARASFAKERSAGDAVPQRTIPPPRTLVSGVGLDGISEQEQFASAIR